MTAPGPRVAALPHPAAPTRPIVGVGGIVWRDEEVLLIKRGKPPRRGEWSLPGGRQELGETVEAALRREVLEEVALHLGPLRLVDVVDLVDRDATGTVRHHFTLVDFMADAMPGVPVAGSDAAAVAWFPLPALGALGLWEATLRVITLAASMRREG